MLDRSAVEELLSFVEKNMICSEAVELLERCLAERSSKLLEDFMERQMLTNPDSMDVMQDLAESVHQHMMALQESLFDIRSDMLQALKVRYRIDVTPLVPLDLIEEYHLLELDEAVAFVTVRHPQLSDAEVVNVCHTLHNGVLRAGQITQSLQIVRQILEYIFDWSEALSINSMQSYWQMGGHPQSSTQIH